MTILAFTGTRQGMTEEQRTECRKQLRKLNPTTILQGCCVGADEEFTWVAFHMRGFTIHGYPSDIKNTTSEWAVTLSSQRKPPAPPLKRDKAMVNQCGVLFACPKGFEEEIRSGTWATVRYARKLKKRIIIIWPDGTTTDNKAEGNQMAKKRKAAQIDVSVLGQFVQDMKLIEAEMDELDATKLSSDEIDLIEDVRHYALSLSNAAEAVIEDKEKR